ncbi:MAG TPA: hypothetical protein VHS59_04215 [Bacillota bacterium]|nr:hypothetical protein [Bacillota bacterium]
MMDRFMRGFLAGALGGVVKHIWSYFAYDALHFSRLRLADWASVLIYGRPAASTLELVFATLAYIIFVGMLGVGFAYLIPAINSRNYLFKGVMYGLFLGFVFYALPILFKIPYLMRTDLNTALTTWIGDVLWGLVLAQALKWLDNRTVVPGR